MNFNLSFPSRLNLILAKVALVLIFSTCVIYSQQNIELVESIPIETTLDNPDIRNTQEVWLEMINSAQTTLDIEQFYISNEKGEPLDTILNSIVAAAKRGVVVRIIIDAGMYKTYPESADELDKYDNIEVRKIDIKSITGGIQHSKYFIVDDKEVFLGSQNFDWRALKHIHELGVRIKQKVCISLYKNIFDFDWEISSGKNIADIRFKFPAWHYCKILSDKKFGNIDLYPTFSSEELNKNWNNDGYSGNIGIDSLFNDFKDIANILKIISNAKNEITLQFLSYNPITKDGYWEEVDTALISASKRGVKVKLIVSDWNLGKTAVEHFKELIQYPNFEIRYTEIPDYSGGFIPFARVEHCKFITADSLCWIGTSNMSYDYFYESRNVGLVLENGKFTQRLRDIFYKSWDSEYAHPIESGGEYVPRKRN
jgi:phosphatidylserine/phosphatidylglycerophosphate/cardiolipin synthase-like enzyme